MLSFFPLDVLDEIWDVIESVSEGFLTYSFKDTFLKDEFDLGLTSLVEHQIDFGDYKHIEQPRIRVPVAFASEEKKVVKQLEQQGIMRKSTSP